MTVDPTTLPGWRWLPGMLTTDGHRVLGRDDSTGLYLLSSEDGSVSDWRGLGGSCPDFGDPATGGALVHLLGPEAWRVRYSPSKHKRAAGTPWVADLVGTVTLHATQGEAAAAVAGALGCWGGA